MTDQTIDQAVIAMSNAGTEFFDTLKDAVPQLASAANALWEEMASTGISEVGGYTIIKMRSNVGGTYDGIAGPNGEDVTCERIDAEGYFQGDFHCPYRSPTADEWLAFAEALPLLVAEVTAECERRTRALRTAVDNLNAD